MQLPQINLNSINNFFFWKETLFCCLYHNGTAPQSFSLLLKYISSKLCGVFEFIV